MANHRRVGSDKGFGRCAPYLRWVLICRYFDLLIIDSIHGRVLDCNYESLIWPVSNWAIEVSSIVDLALRPIVGIDSSCSIWESIDHLLVLIGRVSNWFKHSVSVVIRHVLLGRARDRIVMLEKAHRVHHVEARRENVMDLTVRRVHV